VDYIEYKCHCKWNPQRFISLHCQLLRLYSAGNSGVKFMERWWSDTDGVKPKYAERNLSGRYSVHHKSHMDWAGIETESARLEAGVVTVVATSILYDFHT
jgi:hypothetical protein